jgi:4-hydroxy-tetrahydrodipicolinate synthase
MAKTKCSGVWPAVATPFRSDLSVDQELFCNHCRQLLAQGASGLSILGTTGEANSMSISERIGALESVLATGVSASELLPGTTTTSLMDTVTLTRHAVEAGCAGVLLLPPFYYKNIEPEGLFRWVAEVVERVGQDDLHIYFYHIPHVSGVPWPPQTIEKLLAEFPSVVVGMKDSSGDIEHMAYLIEQFPELDVFPGTESLLLNALEIGAVGCISATANINVSMIRRLFDATEQESALALNEHVVAVRRMVERWPLIPAVKTLLADVYGERGWQRVLPPLEPLGEEQSGDVVRSHRELRERLESPEA